MATAPEQLSGQADRLGTQPELATSASSVLVAKPPATEQPDSTRPINWMALAWFSILLIGAYFPILNKLVQQWSNDEDVRHGFLVPLVALFVVWQRKEKLLQLSYKPAWWGLAILVWGAAQAYLGVVGAELFLQRTAFLISLVGMLLVMGGTALVRELIFPLCLLPFMIPIPTVIYNKITFPLQIFASQVAEFSLDTINIPVFRDGNILELANQKLSVAEACSGIRSLLSLTFMSLIYAWVIDKKVWMRWVLLFCTVPIAIVANAGRVTITGILAYYNPELAKGLFHEMEGFVIFFIAFLMLALVHWLINWTLSIRHTETPDFA